MKNLLLFLLSTFWLSVGLSIFWLLRPIAYIDNFNSYIVCNNGTYYQAGSNFIFSSNGKLDDFNDKKARKICDYGIILDYQDTYSTSETINYRYNPAFRQDSSWLEAIFVSATIFFFANLYFRNTRKKLFFLIISFPLAFFIFTFFLKSETKSLFCQRKSYLITYDFKRSVNKAGRLLHEFDDNYKQKIREEIYKKCLVE